MSEVDLLRDTSLFSGCSEENLAGLGEIALKREFHDGELLFSLGDVARELMVVASGTVRLELPVSILGETQNVPFDTQGRGDVVGWSALVPPNEFTLNGRASGTVTALAFPESELTTLFTKDPEFGFRMVKNLAAIVGSRLRRTRRMWAREIQRSLDERYQ